MCGRAACVVAAGDVICPEGDFRARGALCAAFGRSRRTRSYHESNVHVVSRSILDGLTPGLALTLFRISG
eukprot:2689091-Prymnesium_polylepis.2